MSAKEEVANFYQTRVESIVASFQACIDEATRECGGAVYSWATDDQAPNRFGLSVLEEGLHVSDLETNEEYTAVDIRGFGLNANIWSGHRILGVDLVRLTDGTKTAADNENPLQIVAVDLFASEQDRRSVVRSRINQRCTLYPGVIAMSGLYGQEDGDFITRARRHVAEGGSVETALDVYGSVEDLAQDVTTVLGRQINSAKYITHALQKLLPGDWADVAQKHWQVFDSCSKKSITA